MYDNSDAEYADGVAHVTIWTTVHACPGILNSEGKPWPEQVNDDFSLGSNFIE
jgi:hypothetical protein